MAPPPLPPTSAPGPTSHPTSHPSHTVPSLALRPSEDDTRHRVAKKLQKKRRDGHRTPTMELPDRLKESVDSGDDEEDVRIPPQGGGVFMNMNQSLFGLITAAGSSVDFHGRFDNQSSDEDEEGSSMDQASGSRHQRHKETDTSQTTVLPKPNKDASKGRHRRKISESRLLRSLPSLGSKLSHKVKPHKTKSAPIGEEDEHDLTASTLSPSGSMPHQQARPAPVMSRMLEAKAEMADRPSFDMDRRSSDRLRGSGLGDTGPSPLAKKLREIFQFDHPEEVIEEYPCWLLQSVLLQGYMYITAGHICFYAYLPKKAHEIAKSGYLSKSGKRNPKYNRYWFRLKGDILSYFQDPSNLYFPHGQIDLRYGISASITDKDKDGVHFSVVTDHRTFNFKADSAPSAKEWVKSLQRVIFRSHNEGDSVKISIPIGNVIDVEETQMVEFAETCKIRVIDNDETYAIDEYFFSFFDLGKDALGLLKILVDDTAQKKVEGQSAVTSRQTTELTRSRNTSRQSSPAPQAHPPKLQPAKLHEPVRATLSPVSPITSSPRTSTEVPRASFDALRPFAGRRSMELGRALREHSPRRSFSDGGRRISSNNVTEKQSADMMTSSESYVQSMEDSSHPTASGMVASSSDDPSASQILRGSDVFHSPTVRRSVSASKKRDPDSDSERQSRPNVHLEMYRNRHAATTGSFADPGAGEHFNAGTASAPTLQQSLAKMGTYPMQRAGLYAEWLNKQSRRMSNLLATESMGYVEKVSGMWKGGGKHYDEPAGLKTDDEMDGDDDEKIATSMDRFRAHFALPEGEKLQATFFGYLRRVLPLYGKIYISDRSFCFRSLLPGTRTKLILPLKDVENVDKEKGFNLGYSGLVLVIRGHEELFFEFRQADVRDDCAVTLLQHLETSRALRESVFIGRHEKAEAEAAAAERDALQEARTADHPGDNRDIHMPPLSSMHPESPTILFDDLNTSFVDFKPPEPLNVTCLTIGSRGDVQPYIALCKGLLAEGHKVKIATHAEFEDWILSHGIDFAPVEGDPAELMAICIENGMFTVQFLKEANGKMRVWLDGLLASAWEACKGSDLLIESPSAMAGIHIAEALQIPYFRAFTMPWTRTRAYPHAFIMPEHKMGGYYNYLTYVMFDNVFWKATAWQINRWRNKSLGLPNTNLEKMQPNKVPFLYNFSSYVVPPPLDYSDWVRVTGYWFLDEGTKKLPEAQGEAQPAEDKGDDKPKWVPPPELVEFIDSARRDKKRLVYVGFGSIIVPDPAKMTQEVVDAVLKADVRCILSKGWSNRIVKGKDKDGAASKTSSASEVEVPLPPEIHQIKAAPHDWLFAQIDAAAHHGGSGTTGASLRAGIPTIIRPFFGDQFFFGSRVEDLGVGICLRKWGVNSFARALWEATNSERMITKAKVLGEQIRDENGVQTAIQYIYRDLEYAKSLVKAKAGKNAARHGIDDDDEEHPEESWTFVGDSDADPMRQSVILSPPPTLPPLSELTPADSTSELEPSAAAPKPPVRTVLGSKVLGR